MIHFSLKALWQLQQWVYEFSRLSYRGLTLGSTSVCIVKLKGSPLICSKWPLWFLHRKGKRRLKKSKGQLAWWWVSRKQRICIESTQLIESGHLRSTTTTATLIGKFNSSFQRRKVDVRGVATIAVLFLINVLNLNPLEALVLENDARIIMNAEEINDSIKNLINHLIGSIQALDNPRRSQYESVIIQGIIAVYEKIETYVRLEEQYKSNALNLISFILLVGHHTHSE